MQRAAEAAAAEVGAVPAAATMQPATQLSDPPPPGPGHHTKPCTCIEANPATHLLECLVLFGGYPRFPAPHHTLQVKHAWSLCTTFAASNMHLPNPSLPPPSPLPPEPLSDGCRAPPPPPHTQHGTHLLEGLILFGWYPRFPSSHNAFEDMPPGLHIILTPSKTQLHPPPLLSVGQQPTSPPPCTPPPTHTHTQTHTQRDRSPVGMPGPVWEVSKVSIVPSHLSGQTCHQACACGQGRRRRPNNKHQQQQQQRKQQQQQ